MPTYTTWFVTVVLQVAGREKEVRGPGHSSKEAAQQDLDALREKLASGEWLDLDWISANPTYVVAAHLDSSSIGFA